MVTDLTWEEMAQENKKTTRVKDLVGEDFDDSFMEWDMSDVQELVSALQDTSIPDVAHAESLAQKALRCADILSEYLSKIVKVIHHLDSRVSSKKNKAALDYEDDNKKVTMEMRKMAGECSPEVEKLNDTLARAKGTKAVLEKKYDIVIKAHHNFKEIGAGYRKSILGYNPASNNNKDTW